MSIRHIIATCIAAVAFALGSAPAWAAVDVNQATQADLETVKGIGPGLSGKILAARQQGAFKDWSDFVDRVAGIGPGNAARFSQAGLTVAGSAYSADAAPAKPAAGGSRGAAAAEKSEKGERAARSTKAGKAEGQ